MPPPPWQQPQFGAAAYEYGPPTPRGGRGGAGKTIWIAAAMGVVVAVLVFGSVLLVGTENGRFIASGDSVTPTSDEYMVFMDETDIASQPAGSVRCTASTAAGEELTGLQPAEQHTITRGRRSLATKYLAMAELPTDKGPLTVQCTAANGKIRYTSMLLAAPEVNRAIWLVVGYAVLLAVVFGGVFLIRRRYFRKYPRPAVGFRM
jgi:hypothetical protein